MENERDRIKSSETNSNIYESLAYDKGDISNRMRRKFKI